MVKLPSSVKTVSNVSVSVEYLRSPPDVSSCSFLQELSMKRKPKTETAKYV